jgi:hypothetical protein
MKVHEAVEVHLHGFSASAYIKESDLFHLLAALTPVYIGQEAMWISGQVRTSW